MSNKKWSLSLRVYHWLNAFVIFMLFITVVLRKSILNKADIKLKLKDYLTSINIELSDTQLLKLAREINHMVWDWHFYFGFALGVLILMRLLLFFSESGKITLKDALSIIKGPKKDNYWIKLLYMLVYLAIIVMVITGLTMYFKKDLGIDRDFANSIESIHVGVMNIIIYFIPIHIIGVILAENEDQAGITSDMINGGKQ